MRGFIGTVAVFTIILMYIDSSSAFKCVICNSEEKKDCGDKFVETVETKEYYEDCPANVTMCRKIVQEVYIINDWKNMKGDWNTRVIRQCAPTEGREDCIDRTGTFRVKMKYCHCRGEMCNGSSHIQTSVFAILSSLILSLGFLATKYL